MLRGPQAIWLVLSAALLVLAGAPARAGTVADEATAQIRKALPPGLALVSFSVSGGDRPASDDVAVVWHTAPRPGPGSVQVNGGSSKLWARIVLASVGDVIVVTRAIAAKDTIRPGDLKRETRPLLSGRELAIDPDYLDGATAARPLTAGATLDEHDLILPPPIPRGTPVKVVIEAGTALVTTHGTLERAAHVGERSSARLDGIPRILEGQLIDPTTLRITKGNR
jgi:flagella basal body P-ring formation protein FlgA